MVGVVVSVWIVGVLVGALIGRSKNLLPEAILCTAILGPVLGLIWVLLHKPRAI